MGLEVKKTGSGEDFAPVPAGVHHAVCIAVYDIGTHMNPISGKDREQLVVTWEVPGERVDFETKDGEKKNMPMVISKFYTASLHEKATLRKDLEGWRERKFTDEELDGFHLGKLLGLNCMIQVMHDKKQDRTVAKILTVMKKMKNLPDIPPEHPLVIYSIPEPNMARVPKSAAEFLSWGKDIPKGTPEFVEGKIKLSHEFSALYGTSHEYNQPPPDYDQDPGFGDDDIPF